MNWGIDKIWCGREHNIKNVLQRKWVKNCIKMSHRINENKGIVTCVMAIISCV
jgi:hypothetical protein